MQAHELSLYCLCGWTAVVLMLYCATIESNALMSMQSLIDKIDHIYYDSHSLVYKDILRPSLVMITLVYSLYFFMLVSFLEFLRSFET